MKCLTNNARAVAAAITSLALTTACGEPRSSDEPTGERAPPFEWRKITDADGERADESGSLVVTRKDGSRTVLGFDAHEDASGASYAVGFEATEARSGTTTETLRAIPVDVTPADPLETEQRYRAVADRMRPGELEYRLELLYGIDPTLRRPKTVLSRELRATIAEDPERRLDVLIALEHRPRVNPIAEAERRRLDEDLSDDAVKELRSELLRAYAAETHASQRAVIETVRAERGTIKEQFWAGNIVSAELDAGAVGRLARRGDVRRIDLNSAIGPEAVDGWELLRGIQMNSYTDSGFTGERANSARHDFGDITLAFIDVGFEDDVPMFLDLPGGPSRIRQMWDCAMGPCTTVSDMSWDPSEPLHGLRTAGIAVGDLVDGQDPAIATFDERRRRSGICPECSTILIRHARDSGTNTNAVIRALELAATLQVDGTNISHNVGTGDCDGVSAVSEAVNDLVRVGGVFFTKSAGNEGHADPSACTVTAPGAATYAFAVGGTLSTESIGSGDFTTVRTGPIFSTSTTFGSSRGGTPYLFGTRSIIATVAPAGRSLLPNTDGTYTGPGCCGTSAAAPQLLGAFADFRDWWLTTGTYVPFVNHPANSVGPLLLMGDRQRESGSLATAGYDELFGNGRFRARLFTAAGMDAPWGWSTGSIGVYNGSTSGFTINAGAPLPAGVDRLVVVAWWPEANQADAGADGADITLRITSTCGGSASQSDMSFDTKKRVVRRGADVAGRCWRIELTGHTVTANPWQGDELRRSVYYAYYWEDEARDDVDGPPSDVQ